MRSAWLSLLVSLIPLLAPCCREARPATKTRTAAWDDFRFRELKLPRTSACNLELSAPGLSAADAEIRLLFEIQPENRDYYFLSLTRGGLLLGKVECGVEIPLTTWQGDAHAGPGAFAAPQKITVMRRPNRIAVAVDARRVIDLCDDTFTQGRAAVGARGLPATMEPIARVQRTGEIYVADNFMRTRDESAAWRPLSGEWAVESLQNPGLSANAFVYAGRAPAKGAAVTVLGETWWDDYSFEVSAKPAGDRGIGIVVRHVDADNYYVLRHAPSGSAAALELVRVLAGRESVLARRPSFLRAGQWYRLRLLAAGDLLVAYVDGNAALEVRDPHLVSGRVGLYVTDPKGAEFDDVFVRGERGIVDDFRSGRTTWSPKGGTWFVAAVGENSRPRLRAVGPSRSSTLQNGKLLGGDDGWADYRVSTTIAPATRGQAGVIVRYRDETQYDAFVYDGEQNRYVLTRVRGGKAENAATAPAKPLTAPRLLAVELAGAVLVCEAAGERVLSHFDEAAPSGKAGLFVGRGAEAAFDNLEVSFPREKEPVLTYLETFAAETTMASWAAAESDWTSAATDAWGQKRQIEWHRAAFPGGGEIRVSAFFDPTQPATLRLLSCCTLPEGPAGRIESGYELIAVAAGGTAGALKLAKNGQEVASRDQVALRGNCRVALRTVADHVIAEVNGKPLLAYRDAAPLRGSNSGYAADRIALKPEDVDVFCDRAICYSFVQAASDWRSAGGDWLVTNRWRCDPRWSFFGGESLSGVAAIWHKATFVGDMTLEFAAGIRHQGSGGGNYAHASDMNAVICGDGRSLATGYGFVFGGWGNSKTAITRNGKVVAEARMTIPGGIHRRWFYFKIVKKGRNLKYYIDNALALEYDDPEPLPDGQAALWTWKNGLMVARVRIAADDIGPKERFDVAYPPVSASLYTD